MPPTALRVMHRCPVWLPQTQAWLYHQIEHLPGDQVASVVVCDDLANLDQFGRPGLHAFKAQPGWRQLGDRALHKLRLREHYGLAVRVGRRERADLVHSHFGPVGWRDLPVARALGRQHVVSFYGADAGSYPRTPPWRQRYRELFARADRVLGEGPHMLESLHRLGCPREKLRLHRLGVPLERLPFRPRERAPDEPLRVLIASGFREKKGIPLGLEALARALPRLPGLEITIVGDAADDADSQREKARILETLRRTGLESRTRLAGLLPYATLFEEAFRHHLFLAPSREAGDGDTEGGAPLLLIELLATGMLGVTTRHADIPQIVPEDSGMAVPENDVDALVETLVALAAEPERWPATARELRRHLERRFDVRRQGEALAEIYREVLKDADGDSA